jgi:hypothetical protein
MLDVLVFFSEKDAPGCLNLHCETLAHQVGIIANKHRTIYTHKKHWLVVSISVYVQPYMCIYIYIYYILYVVFT